MFTVSSIHYAVGPPLVTPSDGHDAAAGVCHKDDLGRLKSLPETGNPMTDGKTASLAAYKGVAYIDGEFAPEFWSHLDNEGPCRRVAQRPQHVVGCISSVDECFWTGHSDTSSRCNADRSSWRLDALPESTRLRTSKWTKILRLQSCNTACQLAASSVTSFPIPLPTSASATSHSRTLIAFRHIV